MTSSGWEAYYLFFLAGGAALAIPITLRVFAKALRKASEPLDRGQVHPPRDGALDQNRESLSPPSVDIRGQKMNTRYFHGAAISTALLVLALIMAPFAAGMRNSEGAHGSHLMSLLLLSSYLLLGVLYVSRKGDARWLESILTVRPEAVQKQGEDGSPNEGASS